MYVSPLTFYPDPASWPKLRVPPPQVRMHGAARLLSTSTSSWVEIPRGRIALYLLSSSTLFFSPLVFPDPAVRNRISLRPRSTLRPGRGRRVGRQIRSEPSISCQGPATMWPSSAVRCQSYLASVRRLFNSNGSIHTATPLGVGARGTYPFQIPPLFCVSCAPPG